MLCVASGTRSCGGDCLRCMAEAGDPDCIRFMRNIEPSNPQWQEKT
jgi:hypothetical protein